MLVLGAVGWTALRGADDPIDRIEEALAVSAWQDQVRARASGSLDLEDYGVRQPGPGLIDTHRGELFNPRLSLFLDAQVGGLLYAFAQSRLDRGFDPGDRRLELRLDEYAVRIAADPARHVALQAGKFATLVGNWTRRHDSWDNPLVTAPLPYENLTGIWDTQGARSAQQVLAWAGVIPQPDQGGAYLHADRSVPVIWGPSYASGAALLGQWGKFDYGAEVKNTALSARPDTWSASQTDWAHPTFSGRIGYAPNAAWNFGASASTGCYLTPAAAATLPAGGQLSPYRENLFGLDAAFAWHHFQAWAEVYETRFAIPAVGAVSTTAYYAESRYTFSPQAFGALRWNQQVFSSLPNGRGGTERWGRNVWRIDAGPGYRFTPHLQLKVQGSLQREEADTRRLGELVAVQLTLRF